jgi:hypothetical protein
MLLEKSSELGLSSSKAKFFLLVENEWIKKLSTLLKQGIVKFSVSLPERQLHIFTKEEHKISTDSA